MIVNMRDDIGNRQEGSGFLVAGVSRVHSKLGN